MISSCSLEQVSFIHFGVSSIPNIFKKTYKPGPTFYDCASIAKVKFEAQPVLLL